MDDNGWEESRETVVRGLQWRLEKELRELENPALSATDRRNKAASAAHIEESMRCKRPGPHASMRLPTKLFCSGALGQ